jgi:hypothetical protein
MTTIWGPLGWMTLHSVASLYPDEPSESERQLMIRWLDLFRDTITCPTCQGHFAELLATYRAQFPNMLYSRRDFLLFTFRAHNAVNRRLNKPVYQTVQACFDLLRKNVQFNKTQGFRITYTNHITRHWRTFQDASGLSAMKKIHEIKKIELSYMSPRSNEFEVMIPDENVGYIPNEASNEPLRPMPSRISGRMVMTSAGFRMQR